MALDPVTNFAKVEVSTGYDASATEVELTSGGGDKLPIAININNAELETGTLSVSTQTTNPPNLVMSTDGEQLFVTGSSLENVYQYDLTTGFDLTTGSYASKNLSTNVFINTFGGLAFSFDGDECYFADNATDDVYQASLGTSWDLGSPTYDLTPLDVSSEETSIRDCAISDDGTKFFIVGDSSDTVYMYDLSTAYDVSSGSYSGDSFSVSSQATQPYGLSFTQDGLMMFVFDNATNDVFRYELSSAWDITTASYTNESLDVTANALGVHVGNTPLEIFVPNDNELIQRYSTGGSQYNLVWYNSTDYPDPSDDPDVEIVRVESRNEDTLMITRAQEDTTATAKNIVGKTYKMILTITKKTIDDINTLFP